MTSCSLLAAVASCLEMLYHLKHILKREIDKEKKGV